MNSAVTTVAAWRQCREESYQKVRKVIENVCFSPMYFLTFYTFPQQFPNFLIMFFIFFYLYHHSSSVVKVAQTFPLITFFSITFLIFPHSIPHFFLTTFLTLSHNFPHSSTQLLSFFLTTFLIFPHNFPHFSSQLSSFFHTIFLTFPHNFLIFKHVENIKKVLFSLVQIVVYILYIVYIISASVQIL